MHALFFLVLYYGARWTMFTEHFSFFSACLWIWQGEFRNWGRFFVAVNGDGGIWRKLESFLFLILELKFWFLIFFQFFLIFSNLFGFFSIFFVNFLALPNIRTYPSTHNLLFDKHFRYFFPFSSSLLKYFLSSFMLFVAYPFSYCFSFSFFVVCFFYQHNEWHPLFHSIFFIMIHFS